MAKLNFNFDVAHFKPQPLSQLIDHLHLMDIHKFQQTLENHRYPTVTV
jgi:hypothetical protein